MVRELFQVGKYEMSWRVRGRDYWVKSCMEIFLRISCDTIDLSRRGYVPPSELVKRS
jgi:hypothetical protein